MIDYWATAGNWTTLRNVADLLRRLGDPAPATFIDAAADQAPDAPVVPTPDPATPRPPAPGRTHVLDIARRAVERHLSSS